MEKEIGKRALGHSFEYVFAIATSVFFNLGSFAEKRLARNLESYYKVRNIIGWEFTLLWLAGMGVIMLLICTIGYWGIAGVINGTVAIGTLVGVISFLFFVEAQLESYIKMNIDLLEYKTDFQQLGVLLKDRPLLRDVPPVVQLPKAWKTIAFKKVHLAYSKDSVALKNITAKIHRGERIAMVGPSGAGKSSTIKMLVKQLLPARGCITMGGVDTRHVRSSDIAKEIAVVPQVVDLFHTSIADNIRLDAPFNAARMKRALTLSHSSAFVAALPKGIHTQVGERGVKLSGGQRQRIGIARAVYRGAEVIVFDEATASLDAESELHIQKATEEVFVGRTAIIIAHRLATIKKVDRIFVFEKGKLVEAGTLKELIQKRGLFARMWKLQSLDTPV